MFRLALLVTSIATFAGVGRAAAAQTLYATGFENPPFTSGQPLVGQDGWVNQVYQGNPLGPNGAITTAHPASGQQSVQVNGVDLTPTDLGFAAGSYRQFVNYDTAAGSSIVRVEADIRLDGPGTTPTADYVTGDFVSANLATFSGDGDDLGELSLSSDGHIYSYSADDSYLFAQSYALGTYHHLALDLNFAAHTTTFRVDGAVVGSAPFDPTTTSSILSRGSFVMYGADPDSLNRDRTPYSAYYDNFGITAGVPEPSSAILAATAVVALVFFNRRLVQ